MSLKHLRTGANVVHAFCARRARLILRLTDDRHRTRDQLCAELDFIRFAAFRGVWAACPVPSVRGALVETFHVDDGTTWHAVAFEALRGRRFRFFSRDIDRPLFRAWGAAMGRLHAASRDLVPTGSPPRPSWSEQDTTRCDITLLRANDTEAWREHSLVYAWLASRSKTPSSWGLIHGDFERTNFVIDGGDVGVYDFDDACYHWYAADVAHALWAFRGAPPADRARILAWFMDGYGEHASLEGDPREQISWFVRLRTLSLFLHKRAANARSHTGWVERVRAGFGEPFSW